jgi:serine/threonine protein kinase
MTSPEKIVFRLPQQIHLEGFDLLIKEEIGKGGFGSVYLAEYEDQAYAAKLYRMWEILPDERADILQRIYQEYHISENIISPHVIKIFAYRELLGNPLLVMELCEGGSLREKIGQPMSFVQILKIMEDICRGLAAMHREGIVHRDIKPENILLKKDHYCITDFGISANLNHRITQTDIRGRAKQVFASAAYSPPEQANGKLAFKNTGPTNDIYALGVLLYEILTRGKLPYGSFEAYEKDPLAYESGKKSEEWDEESLLNMQADDLWVSIIRRCLRNKASKRFQGVDEILALLPVVQPVAEMRPIPVTTQSAYLEVMSGEQRGLKFFVSRLARNKGKSRLTIGRFDPEMPDSNDILIEEKDGATTSRYHATLERFVSEEGAEEWLLRDGQWISVEGKMQWYTPTNGTYLNGERIGREGVFLQEGDLIKVGSTKMQYQ